MRLFITSIVAVLALSAPSVAADARKLSEAEMDSITAAGNTKVYLNDKLVSQINDGKKGTVEKDLPKGGHVKIIISADGSASINVKANDSASVVTATDRNGNQTVAVNSPKITKEISKSNIIVSQSSSGSGSKSTIISSNQSLNSKTSLGKNFWKDFDKKFDW